MSTDLEKHALREELRPLLEHVPAWVSSAGVMATRTWLDAQRAACRALKNERATAQLLKSSVATMTRLQQHQPTPKEPTE